MHLPLGCHLRAKAYFSAVKACSCPGKHSQHLRKLVTRPLQYDSTTSRAVLSPHYSPPSPFAFESLRYRSTTSNMTAPPSSSSDKQGRTLVLAFDGTSNQFDDTVSRVSPTLMTKALNLLHDLSLSNPWIEHKRSQVLFCFGSPISLATTQGPEFHSPPHPQHRNWMTRRNRRSTIR